MTFNEIKTLENKYHFQIYGRYAIALENGRGSRVTDTEGREYIDMLAGIAVNSLGHCHPKVVSAIKEQAEKLIHCTNLYYIEPQAKLAQLLVENGDLDRVFFCNSGTEAIEGAIKLARKWASKNNSGGKVVSANNSFHGRTLAAVAATGQPKFKKGLDPLPAGFENVPYNDLDALAAVVDDDTCAVLLEPIQGEGGVLPADPAYLQGVRRLCDDKNALLIFDEIQCGLGRAGHFYAHQGYGVTPDIMALAKALGGGFPLGAFLAKEEVANAFSPGDHGTTFGGNPLACAAGFAAVSAILDENLSDRSREMGEYMVGRLHEMTDGLGVVEEIRGRGLMLGVVLNIPGKDVVSKMLEYGVLGNCTADRVIRFVPPLNIPKEDIDDALEIFVRSLKEVLSQNENKETNAS